MTALEIRLRVLREAATSMRELHPISHPRHEMWEQMALMLEETAAAGVCPDRVYAVAVAYLATVDRPDLDGSIHA